jgi:hypothetical protein
MRNPSTTISIRPATARPRPARRARQAYHAAVESLEQRQLLAVDLAGAFGAAPTPVASGTSQLIPFTLTNNGDSRLTAPAVVDVYANAVGSTFSTDDAFFLGRFTIRGALNAGASRDVTLAIPVNGGLVAGSYNVVAVLDPDAKIAEADETNNIATSADVTVTQPDYDLVPTFGAINTLPPSIITGKATNANVQVVLTNPGTAALPQNQKVGVTVVARPVGAVDNSQDVVISKGVGNTGVVNVSVNKLAASKTAKQAVPIRIPANLAAGTYNIIAISDVNGVLAETNEANNEVVLGASTLTVADAFVDLGLTVSASTNLPSAVVTGNANTKLPVKLDITNNGNVATTPNQKVTVTFVAHRASDNTDVAVQTFNNVALGNLAAGKTRSLTLTPTLPQGLTAGDYTLVATLTPVGADDVAGNNADATDAFTAAPAFNDLNVSLGTSTLSTAIVQGTTANGSVKVNITNDGNVALPANQRATVTVALRPVGASDASTDLVIGTIANAALSRLGVNGVRTVTVPVKVLSSAASGDYTLVATVTPGPALAETSTDNNTAAGVGISLASAFRNVGIASADTTFADNVLPGATGTGTVTLTNAGNVAAQGNATVNFYATTTGDIADGTIIGSKNVPVNLQSGQTSSVVSVPLTLPGATGTYTILAQVVPSGFVDSSPLNDTANAGSVTSANAFTDLAITSATNPFGSNAAAGAAAQGGVTLQNVGTGAASGNVTVTYFASTTGTLDNTAVPIGTATFSNLSLAANAVSSVGNAALTLPSPVLDTTYWIFAQITTTTITDTNAANDQTEALGTVLVAAV